MSRYVLEINLSNMTLKDNVEGRIKEMLTENDYAPKNTDNEAFWAKGDEDNETMCCISYEFKEKSLVLMGWIYDATIDVEFDLEYSYLRKLPARSIRNLIEDIASMAIATTNFGPLLNL